MKKLLLAVSLAATLACGNVLAEPVVIAAKANQVQQAQQAILLLHGVCPERLQLEQLLLGLTIMLQLHLLLQLVMVEQQLQGIL